MPSDTLELLDGIVKRAEAVADRSPGQPLRAGDWNALAEAVARLARLVATRERSEGEALAKSFARADHAHTGQVGIAWLDAPTRALLEGRGAGGEVGARLDALARENTALRGEVTALSGQVARLRDALSGTETGNIVRERELGGLRARLDGVLELDRRVSGLDGRLGRLDEGVREALVFRDTLRDTTGQPVDLRAVLQRMDGLAAAQDRLRLADGEVVRIRDFENRIATLEAGGITEAAVDARIGARLDVLVANPDNALLGRVTAGLEPRFAALEGVVKATDEAAQGLRAAAEADRARLGALDTRLGDTGRRLDRTAAGLEALAPLPARVATVEASARTATQRLGALDALGQDMGRLRDQVAGAEALAPRVAQLETTAGAQDRRLGTAERAVATLPDLGARVAQAEAAATRADALGGRLDGAEARLGTLDTRLNVEAARLNAVEALSGRVSVLEGRSTELIRWRGGVDTRLAALPTGTGLQDLTARLDVVEQRTSDQLTRISAAERSLQDQGRRLAVLNTPNPGGGLFNPILGPGR